MKKHIKYKIMLLTFSLFMILLSQLAESSLVKFGASSVYISLIGDHIDMYFMFFPSFATKTQSE